MRIVPSPACWAVLLLLVLSAAGNLALVYNPGRAQTVRTQLKNFLHQTEEAKFERELPELSAYFSQKSFANQTEKIDFAREWVASSSVHDDRYDASKPPNTTELLRKLFVASQGKASKPGLTCGPRALLLERIFLAWGLRVRLVSIFFVNALPDEIGSHTYLEVLNPDNDRWEAVDPDNNLYYTDEAGRRLSTLEISARSKDKVIPVRDAGRRGRQLLRDDYFRFPEAYKHVSIREIGGSAAVYLKDGFYDPARVFKKNGCTLPQFFAGQKNLILY